METRPVQWSMDEFYRDALRFGCLQVRLPRYIRRKCPAKRGSRFACPLPQKKCGDEIGVFRLLLRYSPLSPSPDGPSQGFKHFSLYLRGREELLVTVFHGDAADIGSSGGGAGGEAGARSMGTICESAAAAGSLPKSMKTRCVTP